MTTENLIHKTATFFRSIFNFYIEGFKSMTIGRTLWALIIIKLFILFAIIKVFFFPDLLKSKFDNDDDRAQYVRNELIQRQ